MGKGYSDRINDPAFSKFGKKYRVQMLAITGGLAVLSVVGFYIYGKFSTTLPGMASTITGIGLGVFFLVMGVYLTLKQKLSTDWEGVIVNKEIRDTTRAYGPGELIQVYQYVVTARDDKGAIHTLEVDDLESMYHYYNIGERVRAYAGLLAWEKYDKTMDRQVICVACQRISDQALEYCPACKCPLLK